MITYDKYGHCVVCHKNMLIEAVIDNKVQKRFTPEYQETEFLLDDGSKMRVAICESCKSGISKKDETKIMDCVKEGWKVELDGLPHWSNERKQKYLDKYMKLEIVCNSDNVPKDILDNKLKEHKRK